MTCEATALRPAARPILTSQRFGFTDSCVDSCVRCPLIVMRPMIGVFPLTQVGACIVDKNNRILSMGYNGMPAGCDDDAMPWGKVGNPLDNKYFYVCHAELNSILNYRGGNLKDAIIYSTLFPCNECAKAIIQCGIKEVVYMSDKYASTDSTIASKRMFDMAGVKYRQFESKGKKITLDL